MAESWSCVSRIWNACGRLASLWCARKKRLHRPWKVPIHMPRTLTGSMADRRAIISLAALLVKVTARMPPGDTWPVCSSQAMRVVSTRVLPEPAPARISACSLGKSHGNLRLRQHLLLPRKCRVESRSECDASVELGGRTLSHPGGAANMKTVVDETICTWMAQNGYFYVMHRFDLDNVQFVKDMHAKGCYASISLGVKPDYAGGPAGGRGPDARVHHHRHRPRPCRQREEHDRLPQAAPAQAL
jgi:hypothetical protein